METEKSPSLASRVYELRLQHGYSQKELGDKIGLSHKSISTIESGYRLTSIEKLIELAELFGVSTDYLLGLTDNPARNN